jgi:hypothetical protein
VGKPSEFTQEVADVICSRIMAGESLKSICRADGLPEERTVYNWLNKHESFVQQYVRAREVQADVMVDEIIPIADEELDPQRAKVRIDARKWVAAKVRPKKYGDKLTAEVQGADGGPISMRIERVIVDPASNA